MHALLLAAFMAAGVQLISGSTHVDGRETTYVKVRLDTVQMKAGLGLGIVGRTESLGSIARRYGAIAAINGGYFEAYTSGPIKNPDTTIISDGRILNKGDLGSLIYFDAFDRPTIDRDWTAREFFFGAREGILKQTR